eukprot:Protomagalhaensia_wolfi_Nauph_80__61@NODE_1037_length_1783_cov_28_031537_g783_i0_p2_GENE_NODE_1037_length_1783_cov_28_031537_g783_i0NODE_1037_length_1783_cov_28_031537_g783_i0_p2_ORF_typecomplete_len209_score34_98_NODE_1037_length_1783_cov_28_031537_g783_i046627
MAAKRKIHFCLPGDADEEEPERVSSFLKGGGLSVSVTTIDAFTDDLLSEEEEDESESEFNEGLPCPLDCDLGGDEDSQALLLEGYILNLIKKSSSLSFSSLIGLRHDLELLGLADLLALLRALFALTETLQCESLTQLFSFNPSNHVIEAATSVPTTDPARQILLSLLKQIYTSLTNHHTPDASSNSCSDSRH